MKAEFIGCTLVVTPESDAERDQLKYYGGPPSDPALWECFGWEEIEQSWSAQGLCPVGLTDIEVLSRIAYLLECDYEAPDYADERAFSERIKQDGKIVTQIRRLLGCTDEEEGDT